MENTSTSNSPRVKGFSQFDGLYGQTQAQIDAEYLFSELLETRSRSFNWVIQPHLHARLFQVFLVETGHVTFQEATRQRHLTAPVLLLIPPNALHGFRYSSNATGRILTLSKALVDSLFSNSSLLSPLLGAVQCLTSFEEPYSAGRVGTLLKEIDQELFDNQPEKRLMLRVCLQRLFLVLFRIWQQHEVMGVTPNTQALRYFRQFQQRVRQAGTTHGVAQFAGELAITPGHLNRICQEVAGQSASLLVQEHILDEARKYLIYTNYSVSEIAYLLHFKYPNYFAKFFRKHMGLTPTDYREGQQVG
ncbi:helix-turn-helix domain-containing protein [Hymenobacter sp. GOD-10R]|uniref:helix-turn-helix domain-containing protein n=1 Tax=Hymenobacter sp. GOD-10R TaxID=3093922 RepID=UPI002D774684|nr:helix-turn-helix domain-containing protein [Hymenobacter sp. GOD-10R]WRQ31700.1 helix-turn-helix domain-containing protein [Hymenobacter sp. GOD-10R]